MASSTPISNNQSAIYYNNGSGTFTPFSNLQVSGATFSVDNAGNATLTIASAAVGNIVAGTGITVTSVGSTFTVTNAGVTSIAGTSNQITASASTGGVTLSLPSSIQISGHYFASTDAVPAYVMNSAGSDYGYLGNTAANTWAIGYSSSTTALGTSIATFVPGTVTITGTGTGSGTGLYVNGGDITAARTSSSGVVYFGTGGNYIYFDGSNITLEGGNTISSGCFSTAANESLSNSYGSQNKGLYNVYGNLSYGSWMASGATNGYYGYNIDDGWEYPCFMSQGSSTFGVYCQGGGFWSWYDTGSAFNIAHAISAPSISTGAISGSTLAASSTTTLSGNLVYTAYAAITAGTPTVIQTNAGGGSEGVHGQIGIGTSSARFKKNITTLESDEAETNLFKLRPVKFQPNIETSLGDGNSWHFGLIAEEVYEAIPDMTCLDAQGKPLTVLYQELAPLMLPILKKHDDEIKALQQQIADLQSRLLKQGEQK